MRSLQKDTLTVYIATVITSGIIVLTNNTVANEKSEINSISGNLASSKRSGLESKRDKSVDKPIKNKVESKAISIAVSNTDLLPPPGPFLNKGMDNIVQKSLVAPEEPKKPSYAPSKLIKPELKLNPSIGKVPALAKKAPEFKKAVPAMPEKRFKQAEMVREKRPIWMQKSNAMNQQKFSPESGIAQHPYKTGLNKKHNSVQYVYVPVIIPMAPSNIGSPKAPIFNRNISSPPIYWGAKINPLSARNIEIKKGPTGNHEEQIQKGHN